MADDTDWQTLKSLCDANGCYLSLRCETFNKGAEYRFALSAITKAIPTRTINDIRLNITTNAPQYAVTQMVTQALNEWWPVAAE